MEEAARPPLKVNADKPHLWKEDIAASVDLFNSWFMLFAPEAYRTTRVKTTESVKQALLHTSDFRNLAPDLLKNHPGVLPTLRMSTAPPIARDRLVGLAKSTKNLVKTLEDGTLPARMTVAVLDLHLARICEIIEKLLDRDIFPWLESEEPISDRERTRASTIVADRLCGAVSDPIVRNAQEQRQLALMNDYLTTRGYVRKPHPATQAITIMEPGTFTFHMNLVGHQVEEETGAEKRVNVPIDVVIQPCVPRPSGFPILIEAKSAGDFTNTNKRRKEEATKTKQLRANYGKEAYLVLLLCGYFDSTFLGYEAAEGLDWVWEHRLEDLSKLGI